MKKLFYLLVLLGVSFAHAGSYEDFFVAIKRDNPRAIQDLLQRGFDPNVPDPGGTPGLFTAVRDGALKAAEVLVAWPATKVEWRNAKDESPLMMAALRGHTELVRKLIARDADVNKPGWAPLHYAATGGHLEIMALLLEHHAFIDAQSPNKTTPLMMAAHYGSPAAVKLLLDAGADTSMRNELGLTAIDFANRANRRDAADLIAASVRSAQPRGKW
ncbi:MAG TPA: ankyrin repeat domain-containing protein [Ramlibacter sp.]|jgi:ankyrin repeat protein